jgi:hypothetical protein
VSYIGGKFKRLSIIGAKNPVSYIGSRLYTKSKKISPGPQKFKQQGPSKIFFEACTIYFVLLCKKLTTQRNQPKQIANPQKPFSLNTLKSRSLQKIQTSVPVPACFANNKPSGTKMRTRSFRVHLQTASPSD